MSLLKINDIKSNNNNTNNCFEEDIAIGIDLGTTNTVAVCYLDNKAIIIPQGKGNLLPSVVRYYKDKIIVGNSTSEDKNVIVLKSIKRLMGKSIKDINSKEFIFNIKDDNGIVKVEVIKDIWLTPEEISAEILKNVKDNAERYLKKTIKKAVITVPAYFDDKARVATKHSANLAGLEVLRLVNEPTAAALAYGLDEGIEGVYIIYDFGGGTFDVSILRLSKGIFKVISTLGDLQLGGDDIDFIIAEEVLKSFDNILFDSLNHQEKGYILHTARFLKESLTSQQEIKTTVKLRDQSAEFIINQGKFQQLILPIIEKTLEISQKAMGDCSIKGIVLVGGSTKIPFVQQKVAEFFKIKPLCSLDPDEVVARGAGYNSAILTGQINDSLLLDILPLSLGVEIAGDIVEKIIHRNSLIPVSKAQEFTTSKDNQTSMMIHVLQGEREKVQDLRSLAKFTLKNIPPMKAGIARIQVTFRVDADGLLTVEAEEKFSGTKQTVEIKPSWGLSFDDMRKMIEESMINAEDDIVERLYIQIIMESKKLIEIVKEALKEDGDLISEKEIANIKKLMIELQEYIDTNNIDNKKIIEEKKENLEKSTQFFAELRMDKKIKEALKGKSIK